MSAKMRAVELAGKRCVITGAASGIGRATALAAAERGAQLVLTDVRAPGLEETVAMARARGGVVLDSAAVDVTDHEAVAAFARDMHAAHGSMDVVMNVAGGSKWGSVSGLSHEDWRRMVDVNLMGPIHVIGAFVPAMVEAGRGGHLVNVSSAAGLIALPWHAAYSAGKFGLRGVSEVLRFDLRRHGIGVSLVCPGGVDTPMVHEMEIAGVDRSHPVMRKMDARFRSRAATPDQVAARIVRAVERGQSLVYPPSATRAAHFLEPRVPPLYRLVMRLINDQFA